MQIEVHTYTTCRDKEFTIIDWKYYPGTDLMDGEWKQMPVQIYMLHFAKGRWSATLQPMTKGWLLPKETSNWRSVTALIAYLRGEAAKNDIPF